MLTNAVTPIVSSRLKPAHSEPGGLRLLGRRLPTPALPAADGPVAVAADSAVEREVELGVGLEALDQEAEVRLGIVHSRRAAIGEVLRVRTFLPRFAGTWLGALPLCHWPAIPGREAPTNADNVAGRH